MLNGTCNYFSFFVVDQVGFLHLANCTDSSVLNKIFNYIFLMQSNTSNHLLDLTLIFFCTSALELFSRIDVINSMSFFPLQSAGGD